MSKEASCHILEQGMKKGRPLIAGTRKSFFITFNQAKRELGQNSNLQGTSAQRFEDSQESIGLQKKLPVYQSISFDISWFPKQESLLGLFQAQTKSRSHVGLYESWFNFLFSVLEMILTYCNTDDNHPVGKDVSMRLSPPQDLWNLLDTAENLRDADDNIKQNWYEFRETV